MRHHNTPPTVRRLQHVDPSAYRRSYVLPEDIECNIPRHPQPGDCTAWNAARGHLIEACMATGGRPVALLYIDLPSTDPHSWTVQIASTLRLPDGQHVTAIATEQRLAGPHGGHRRWAIQVNGIHVLQEDRVEAPSSAIVGEIVRRALIDPPPIPALDPDRVLGAAPIPTVATPRPVHRRSRGWNTAHPNPAGRG